MLETQTVQLIYKCMDIQPQPYIPHPPSTKLILHRWKFFQSIAPDSHPTATHSKLGVSPCPEIYDQVLVFLAPVLNLVTHRAVGIGVLWAP